MIFSENEFTKLYKMLHLSITNDYSELEAVFKSEKANQPFTRKDFENVFRRLKSFGLKEMESPEVLDIRLLQENNYTTNDRITITSLGAIKKYCDTNNIKEIDNKYVAKQIFIKNMEENLFNFCTRGAGNFSYRFYETLMMGRIPIFIDTECELPFEEQLKGNATVLRLKSLDPDSLILLEYKMQEIMNLDPSYLREIQNKNRQFWLNYYSPLGFCKTLIKAII